MDESNLLAELERRFPSLGTDDDNVDLCDQWDALAAWHAELAGPDYVPKPADCPDCGDFIGNSGICANCADIDTERGSISLPLLTFQACAAVGLASGLWSLYLRLAAQIGGLGL